LKIFGKENLSKIIFLIASKIRKIPKTKDKISDENFVKTKTPKIVPAKEIVNKDLKTLASKDLRELIAI
jgi:hypothetical protein